MRTAYHVTPMDANPGDPVDQELARLIADPRVAGRLSAFLERERRGDLGPGVEHEDVGRRLGLLDERSDGIRSAGSPPSS